jgi:glycosyltransferase involved in cell wall biosynthesis
MIIGIEAAHANKVHRTGVENVCFELVQNLKDIIPSGVDVVLYSNTPLNAELKDCPGDWCVKILAWPFKKLWSQIRLSFELLKNPPDIFIAPGQLIPFFTPKNTVVIVHDSAFMAYPEVYNFWGRQYLKWMNKRIVSRASLIITPSQFSKDELIKYYQADASKIAVAPLGYDNHFFRLLTDIEKERTPEVLKKYNITKPFLLAINRLERKKNTKRIVEAYDILKKDFEVQLVLVGQPGVGYDEIKSTIEQSVYKTDILELGWVEQADLPYLLASARLFFVPSLYEGFGIPLLQAVACGCPVVASNVTSLPEVGGGAVVYVNPENSVDIARGGREILSNEHRRAELVEKGLNLAQKFSWNKFAQVFWKEVQKLPE